MPASAYRLIGAVYVLLGTPALIGLFAGWVRRGGNPYLAMSLMGIPLGILFMMFGFGRFKLTALSQTAAMLAIAGVINLLFMWGASIIVRSGREGFGTAYGFFAVAASFLALVAFVLLVRSAVIHKR